MDLASFRKSRELSQEQVAAAVDLQSKGYISGLESGATVAPLRVALRIHRWSEGMVAVEALVSPEDAALLRYFAASSAAAEAAA